MNIVHDTAQKYWEYLPSHPSSKNVFIFLGYLAFPAEQYPSVFSKSTYLLTQISLSIYCSNVLIRVNEEER